MKRYSLGYVQNAPKCTIVEGPVKLSNIFTMVEATDGGYVKYEDAEALHEALKRMVGACEHYLESQIESESNMYDPKYIGPLEQARKALRGEE